MFLAFGISWRVDKSKTVCFLIANLRKLHLFRYRNSIFVSHVPWLGAFVLSLPMFAKDMKAFRTFSQRCGFRRLQEGSPHKDLFYHLVSASIYVFGNCFSRDINASRSMKIVSVATSHRLSNFSVTVCGCQHETSVAGI